MIFPTINLHFAQIFQPAMMTPLHVPRPVGPKCGNGRAYFRQMQTRSADEPMTTFYRRWAGAGIWKLSARSRALLLDVPWYTSRNSWDVVEIIIGIIILIRVCLVGDFKHDFYFPFHIWDVILPIDELIFFKMVIAPPTRYIQYPGSC